MSKDDMVNEEGVSSSATDCQRRLSTRKLKRVGIATQKVQWSNVETVVFIINYILHTYNLWKV